MKDVENEGFIFLDGVKPTKCKPTTIMAVNRDCTINYYGINGRSAYQCV